MKHVILITDNETGQAEAWTSLVKICRHHEWSYNYLKRLIGRRTFQYRDYTIQKVVVNGPEKQG